MAVKELILGTFQRGLILPWGLRIRRNDSCGINSCIRGIGLSVLLRVAYYVQIFCVKWPNKYNKQYQILFSICFTHTEPLYQILLLNSNYSTWDIFAPLTVLVC